METATVPREHSRNATLRALAARKAEGHPSAGQDVPGCARSIPVGSRRNPCRDVRADRSSDRTARLCVERCNDGDKAKVLRRAAHAAGGLAHDGGEGVDPGGLLVLTDAKNGAERSRRRRERIAAAQRGSRARTDTAGCGAADGGRSEDRGATRGYAERLPRGRSEKTLGELRTRGNVVLGSHQLTTFREECRCTNRIGRLVCPRDAGCENGSKSTSGPQES